SPKTIARKLVGISGMIRMFVMQAMAIHPGDRIDVDRESVGHHRYNFYEPFLVIERAMSDSQMKNIRQIQPAQKPTKDKINSADEQSHPGAQLSWRRIHTSQRVSENDQIALQIVDFHGDSPRRYSNRNQSPFQTGLDFVGHHRTEIMARAGFGRCMLPL